VNKKFTPDYFGWILLFLLDICLALFWLWLANQGFNADREYTFDLGGYSLAFIAMVLFIWNIYEIWILLRFLLVELGRTIEFDESTRKLHISHNASTRSFQINELKEVIFSERRIGTRTPTAHLSYSQLNFRSTEPLLITSFVLNTEKLNKLLGNGSFKRTTQNRKFFEGIRLK
jgi:hypothetical protein